MTQKDQIMDYLSRYGSITPMEAFADLGVTKLATRVSEMSREGVQFRRKLEKNVNRLGKKVVYMRYWLDKEAVHG
jgi:hypothetical protein